MLDTVVGTGHTLMNPTNVVPSLALSFPSQIEFLRALTTLCANCYCIRTFLDVANFVLTLWSS